MPIIQTQTLRMGVKNLLYLLSHILVCVNLATALKWRCYEKAGNFTSNSTYSKNRDLIASSLASKAATNNGFYNTTIGEGSNKVYALVNCRGDSSSEACSTCVSTATEDLLAECPNQKEAISWGGDPPCIIHISDHSFFGTLELDPVDAGYNIGNITTNLTKFDMVWGNLTDSVSRKASGGSYKLKFGTGEAELSPSQTIYALMQCTPDISESDCSRCLRFNIDYFQSCCHGRQGGYVQRPNCVFRWDLYPFYEDVANAPSASPPSPPPTSSSATPNATVQGFAGKRGSSSRAVIATVVAIVVFIAIAAFTCSLLFRRWKQKKEDAEVLREMEKPESLQFDFNTIREATNDFSEENKLGEGGFGAVYKGKLFDGQDIAVKRLSKSSKQGQKEFENEVLLMAKLQHRNLVRLLGFSTQGKERLLIYEFVPQSSLEKYIFDPTKSLLLDWNKRYKIITGIARGTLYLHEDSQLRIIHRDLKSSNILLDAEMNPKISDFGLAKWFPEDITQANASKIAGTLGYMAPEYVQNGQVSVKTDVYSFGVLVLEIISGRKISDSNGIEEFGSLISYAWDNWKKGTAQNFMDPSMRGAQESEAIRCFHLALLCVQKNATHRPSMATVVLMLSSLSISMPMPSRPAFLLNIPPKRPSSYEMVSDQSENENIQLSNNKASLSDVAPR